MQTREQAGNVGSPERLALIERAAAQIRIAGVVPSHGHYFSVKLEEVATFAAWKAADIASDITEYLCTLAGAAALAAYQRETGSCWDELGSWRRANDEMRARLTALEAA